MPDDARNILCGEVASGPRSTGKRAWGASAVQLRLLGKDAEVNLKLGHLSERMLKHVPPRLVDLIELATYVYCADQACTRGGDGVDVMGADWRRRFRFVVPVREPEFWGSAKVTEALRATLGFLSEDDFDFEFVPIRNPPGMQQYLFGDAPPDSAHEPEEVVLFSGGLDSLSGVVQESVVSRRRVALVTHRSNDKFITPFRALCQELDRRAGAFAPLHFPVTINKAKELGREYTQRTRSFLYAALAMTVAHMNGLSRVRFYENGVVSLNLPISPQVVGAKATRTTHPRVLAGFRRIFSLVADRQFEVDNPFMWMTKAEVVRKLADAGCADLMRDSISCTHTWETSLEQPHCGTCSQCIDRQFAVLAAGQEKHDPATRYKVDLLTGERPAGEERTMLASYVETAGSIRKMQPLEFLSRYGEVARAVRYLQGSSDAAAQRVFDLYQRHGEDVRSVLIRAIEEHGGEIHDRSLPDSCLIRLVCDSGCAGGGLAWEVPAPPCEPRLALQPYTFRRKGNAWVVRFAGHDEFILLPSRGAAYLYLLLKNPGKPLSAVEMAFEVAREPNRFQLGNAGPKNDEESQQSYRARFHALNIDRAKAEADHDDLRLEEVRREMEALAGELKGRGWLGRARGMSDDYERARKRVANAIKRTIEAILNEDRDLAAHLTAPRLRCGREVVYEPEAAIDWDL